MRRFTPAIGFLLLALAVCLPADDKKKNGTIYVKPAQTADLSLPKLVTARDRCENWAVAAGLEAMLRSQDVALNQSFWVLRLNHGEICRTEIPSMEALAEAVNSEFVLDDGRHVQLELAFLPGPPTNLDATIAGIRLQRISLLFLRGHAYYLTGVTYDEHIAANGGRMFVTRELRLADTFAGNAKTTFVNGQDSAEEIQGTLSVTVTVLER